MNIFQRYKGAFALIVLLTFMGGLVTAPVACSSTQRKVALNTMVSVHDVADGAYKGYVDLVLSKQVATNGVPAVAKAYREFQLAWNAGLTVLEFNTNAVAPQAVLDASANLLNTIEVVK